MDSFSAKLKALLTLHEGRRDRLYRDTNWHLTGGIGHNFERPLSAAVIDLLYEKDSASAIRDCRHVFSGFDSFSEPRRLALADLMFALGLPRFLSFRRLIRSVLSGDWETAALELLDSKWAREVDPAHGDNKGRADELAKMLRDE